jgi:hypothetical protein
MARRKSAAAAASETPDTTVTPGPQHEEIPTAEFAPDEPGTPAPAGDASEGAEPQQRKFVDTTGQGHRIATGDGRWLRFSRSQRWQQGRIEFVPQKEGEDAKPRPEDGDTKWLRERGWQWRGDQKAWTKQLERNTEEDIYARGKSHTAAHAEFLELANRIRERNGLEPVAAISNERTPF